MSIIQGYNWAQNRSKLERAINEVKEKGEVSEEAVYKVYKRLLGAVIGEVKFEKAEKEAEKAAKKAEKEAKK